MTNNAFWLRYTNATASLPAIVAVGPHVLAVGDKTRILKTRALLADGKRWAQVDGEWRRS